MTKLNDEKSQDWKKQLTPRSGFTLSKNENLNQNTYSPNLLIGSPSDWGVMRNGGKNGSRFAPEVLLNQFKKLVAHQEKIQWDFQNICDPILEAIQFSEAQQQSAHEISMALEKRADLHSLFHLAAGHDHIYPLVKALMNHHKNLIIINIDAHLDTRQDQLPHSGTPFRQLYREFGNRINLAQVGIHRYANVQLNYEDMGHMNILEMDQMRSDRDLRDWLDKVLALNQGPLLISLDCDGLDGSIMPAVSAANHHGLNKYQMNIILDAALNYWTKYQWPKLFGLYEYNPLYDDLHTTSARYLTSLIHKVLVHA
jgi:formiminoglutamase